MAEEGRQADEAQSNYHQVGRELGRIERTGKNILNAERKARRAQALTNTLMVLATVLIAVATASSAPASWRMARVATDIFQASERSYIGVESIRVDLSNPNESASWVKNFGSVPADETVIDVSTKNRRQARDRRLARKTCGHVTGRADTHNHLPVWRAVPAALRASDSLMTRSPEQGWERSKLQTFQCLAERCVRI